MTARTDADNRWHLDKKVPIGIIAAMLLQFAGGLWFVSKLDARILALEEAKVVQAQRDDRQDGGAKESRAEVLRSLERIDEKLDRIIEKRNRP
jgi:hypothetical protein